MSWLIKLIPGILSKRLVKSAVRYCITAFITVLAPIAFPGIGELIFFLQEQLEPIAEILTIIALGVLGFWSATKNATNKNISNETK